MTHNKQCTFCKRDLPAAMFNRDNSRPDGLRSRCKTCRSKTERKGSGLIGGKARLADPVVVKDRTTAYRQALIDLQFKHQDEFQELLQARLREALSR